MLCRGTRNLIYEAKSLKKLKQRIVLPDVSPSAAIRSQYRAELNRLLRSARNDVLEAVKAHWQPQQPIAMDASPLSAMIDQIMIRWIQTLSDLPGKMARRMVGETLSAYDRRMGATLKKAGFTVNLQLTYTTREAIRASVGMNVGLIKSIPMQYLTDVQKYVNEAVDAGFDLATLTDNLEHSYRIGRNRAKLIARDQTSKVHAAMEQARRQELGIKKAIWIHSAAAKEPRHSHVKANGKELDVNKGMYLDGEWLLPGQAINCGCTSKAVIEW